MVFFLIGPGCHTISRQCLPSSSDNLLFIVIANTCSIIFTLIIFTLINFTLEFTMTMNSFNGKDFSKLPPLLVCLPDEISCMTFSVRHNKSDLPFAP